MVEFNGKYPERIRSGDSTAKPLAPETTVDLLALARSGDRAALDRLLERNIPALSR